MFLSEMEFCVEFVCIGKVIKMRIILKDVSKTISYRIDSTNFEIIKK